MMTTLENTILTVLRKQNTTGPNRYPTKKQNKVLQAAHCTHCVQSWGSTENFNSSNLLPPKVNWRDKVVDYSTRVMMTSLSNSQVIKKIQFPILFLVYVFIFLRHLVHECFDSFSKIYLKKKSDHVGFPNSNLPKKDWM